MLFRPDLEYDLACLHDVYGPTGSNPDIQALVVSKETLSGATASMRLSPSHTFRSHVSYLRPSPQGACSQGLACPGNFRHRRHLIRLFKTRPRRRRDLEADKDEQHLYPPMDRCKLCPLGRMRSLSTLYACIQRVTFSTYRLESNPPARMLCEFGFHHE